MASLPADGNADEASTAARVLGAVEGVAKLSDLGGAVSRRLVGMQEAQYVVDLGRD